MVLEASGELNGWLLPAGAAIELAPENPLRLLRTYVPSPDA